MKLAPNAPVNAANAVTTSSYKVCRPLSLWNLVDRDNYGPAHHVCCITASTVYVSKQPIALREPSVS